MLCYIEEPDKIEQKTLNIFNESKEYWSRSATKKFKEFFRKIEKGWNMFFWNVQESNISNFGNTKKIRFMLISNEKTEVYLNSVFTESSDKAKLLLVQDGGYYEGWLDSNLVKG